MRRQPLRLNPSHFSARMTTNAAIADSTKSTESASPAPAQDSSVKAGAAEATGGDKKVKTEKECMIPPPMEIDPIKFS